MTHAAAVLPNRESVTRLVPGGMASLAQLTDDELLASTRRLVGKSNQLLAALLMHLAEVEVRGVHRTRSCASLYTYCIYELRFSEDAAARRSAAARFVKQFPALLDAVAAGELHLTGLLMIGPHLTPENQAEVLGRARFRTKKELAKLVRELNPLPGVPDVVQPLGPEMMRSWRNPTWAQFVGSLCPPVRELPVGARPSDWANEGVQAARGESTGRGGTAGSERPVGGTLESGAPDGPMPDGSTPDGEVPDVQTPDGGARDGGARDGEARDGEAPDGEAPDGEAPDAELPVGPVPADLPPVTSPQRYQLRFETVEEHVELLERAKSLMARERPGVSLGELHLEAMKLLVASLEKRKFAVGARPRRSPKHRAKGERVASIQPDDGENGTQPRWRGAEPVEGYDAVEGRDSADGSDLIEGRDSADGSDLIEGHDSANGSDLDARNSAEGSDLEARNSAEGSDLIEGRDSPAGGRSGGDAKSASTFASRRVRSRHIPAALQCEVYQRDAGRCSYIDSRGQRCGETRYLELHHLEPLAKGGAHATSNLTLRCAAHNRLAAEQDFGRSSVATRRDAVRHESFTRQLVRDGGD